jgi:hypothetical protein
MTKYSIPLTALITGALLSGFTKSEKSVLPPGMKIYQLRIIPNSTWDLSILSNWTEKNSLGCDGIDEKACQIFVDDRDNTTYTVGGSSLTGPTNVTITGATNIGLTTTYYVMAISGTFGHRSPTYKNASVE